MTHGVSRDEYQQLLKTLHQCEATGVKPMVMRQLLEEVSHSWATINVLEQIIAADELTSDQRGIVEFIKKGGGVNESDAKADGTPERERQEVEPVQDAREAGGSQAGP